MDDCLSLEPSATAGVALGWPPLRTIAKVTSDSAAGPSFPSSSVMVVAKGSAERTR